MVETINNTQAPIVKNDRVENASAERAGTQKASAEKVGTGGVEDKNRVSEENVRLALNNLKDADEGFRVASVPIAAINSSGLNFHALAEAQDSIEGLTFNIQDALIILFELSVLLREIERNNWIATANDVLEKGQAIADNIRVKASMTLGAGIIGGSMGAAAGAASIGGGAAALGSIQSSNTDTSPDIDVSQATSDGADNLSQLQLDADVTGEQVGGTKPQADAMTSTSELTDTTMQNTEAAPKDGKSGDVKLDKDQLRIQEDLTKAKINETRIDAQNQRIQARLQLSEGVSSLLRATGQVGAAGLQTASEHQEATVEIKRAEKDRLNVEVQAQQEFAGELRDTINSIVGTFQSVEQARHRAMGAIYNA